MKTKLTHAKNSIHTVKIEDMTNLGAGVAHLDGAAVFVNGAVDGDICDIKIIKCANGYYVGRLEKLTEASPYRIESDCAVSKRCGGCVYRNISYDHELELKRRYVVNAFKKAGIEVTLERVEGTGIIDGYRNKIQYPVSENGSIGYYANHTHDIIPCEDCRLQKREFDRPVKVCGEFIRRYTKPGTVRHLYLRSGESGVTVCLVIKNDRLENSDRLIEMLTSECPEVSGILININKADTNVILGDKFVTIYGIDYMIDKMNGVEYKIAPAAFYQVNKGAAELLYARALEYASPKRGDRLLDLYCGAGTIGLYFASRCPDIKVTGVEIVEEAVVNARENAVRNGIENAEFTAAELGESEKGVGSADIVVLDPPRKGCAESLVNKLCALSVPRIVYVSCAADTLARDAARFKECGYKVERLSAFDLFPRTGHVETVVLLSKGEVDSKKIRVEFSLEDMDMSEFQDGATYTQIKDYVLEHTGLKVSNLYISQIKRKCGIEVGKNYNLPKSEDSRQPQCPPEKEKAITEALKFFGMVKSGFDEGIYER